MTLKTTLSIGTLFLLSVAAVACTGNTGGNFNSPTTPSANLTPTPSPSDPYAGNPTPTPSPSPVDADVTVHILGMLGDRSYSPNPITVRVGQTVAWNNDDGTEHTATADGGTFDTGILAPGETSNPTVMKTAGSFPYHCQIHGFTMAGTVVVTQ